ncbi:MAG: CotH kinase family protein, partial [Synergistaceae bacterium]|nr:CotH kinase family protein [Synergistaceae bacterium]
GLRGDKVYKRAVIDMDSIRAVSEHIGGLDDLSLQVEDGALCHPAGFPCIVYLNGEFYGIFAWQIKKDRKNYHLNKKTPEHIHLDGTLSTATLWGGTIYWTQFEIRDPKNLVCMDGSDYDGDSPQELIDATSDNYDSSNKNHKNTAKVKEYIQSLVSRFRAMRADTDTVSQKNKFDELFDAENFIDYVIFSDATYNLDGVWGKNWQWITYDGGKWFVTPYDLDMTYGATANGQLIMKPVNTHTGAIVNVGLPLYYVIRHYGDELNSRWAMLRDKGIIDPEHMTALLRRWIDCVGYDNYEAEYEKWPDSPCNNLAVINSDYWEVVMSDGKPVLAPTSNYNNNTAYGAGTECTYGLTSTHSTVQDRNIYTFRCKADCQGHPPITAFRHKDNIYRVLTWIEEQISNMDSVYGYNN